MTQDRNEFIGNTSGDGLRLLVVWSYSLTYLYKCLMKLFSSICVWLRNFHRKPIRRAQIILWLNPTIFNICGSFRRGRSLSCPFCRDSLKRVNSGDLWIYITHCEAVDISSIARENLKRLVAYIEKLPLVIPDPLLISYDPRFRWGGCIASCT